MQELEPGYAAATIKLRPTLNPHEAIIVHKTRVRVIIRVPLTGQTCLSFSVWTVIACAGAHRDKSAVYTLKCGDFTRKMFRSQFEICPDDEPAPGPTKSKQEEIA